MFIKPDPGLSLRNYTRRLKSENLADLIILVLILPVSRQGSTYRHSKHLQLPGIRGDGEGWLHHKAVDSEQLVR